MDRWEIYEDRAGEWRWRHWRGSNIVGASSEGYVNRSYCVINARIHGYTGE